jgi:hypothetical protein
MARMSSAAYVTSVLTFLQAYNSGDLDACAKRLDPEIEWHSAVTYKGRRDVRAMLEAHRGRWTESRVRPDDFRATERHVLMIVCFHEGNRDASPREERQSWIADINDEGLISRLISYPTPADAGRAFDALAQKVHA